MISAKSRKDKVLWRVLSGICAFTLTGSLSCNAADIDSVLVRQQWPWSTDVKVEYRLSNVTAPVNINVECFNNGEALPAENIDSAIIGRTYGLSKADEGIGFFYIDPVKAFGKTQVSLANFTVKLTLSGTNELDTQPIYKIIDLQTKQVTNLSRADFYNDRGRKYGSYETDFVAIGSSPSKGTPYSTSLDNVFIWTGVTNDIAYKTTKLVMRRIPAKNKTFMMGSYTNLVTGESDYTRAGNDKYYYEMRLTNDYWLSVFELTAGQYAEMSGKDFSSLGFSSGDLPITGYQFILYSLLRGIPSQWINWPTDILAVGENSWLSQVRGKYQLQFDVPTEAQWEYACRAGTDTQLYTGVRFTGSTAMKADLDVLGVYKPGNTDVPLQGVGRYRPNAFGLYDMLGNLAEMTRDVYPQDVAPLTGPGTEPLGGIEMDAEAVLRVDKSCNTVYRGGHHGRPYTYCRSANRQDVYTLEKYWADSLGARLWLSAE
jgi:formylglycine-generating enzyme required for sulfatase activity